MGEISLWLQHRSATSRYFHRRPEETALYQIIYNYQQELEHHWDELFLETYGSLRPCVIKAMNEYQSCGILRFGCARAYCQSCKHSELVAFSCKKCGICASCAAKRSILFAENLHENILLDQDHRHLVFSIPKRLRSYFKFDRTLLSILHKCARLAWTQYLNSIIPDSTPSMVSSIHTAGRFLEFHPHVHSITLNGAIDKNSNFIPLASIDTEQVETLFQQYVFQALHEKELITEEIIINMSTWSKPPPIPKPQTSVTYDYSGYTKNLEI
ncbi:MAG: transposase zinc-binding domain-containing protein [Deltaproteobacteria bacterium]|nr:transposase zinc-binding domain-containing protein [Deltaproteobacteria bacterium]